MAKPPIHTVHILYDSDTIDDKLLIDSLYNLTQQLSADSATSDTVRLNLIKIGHRQEIPQEPKKFIEELVHEKILKVDLKGAFEQVVSDFRELDKQGQGTANPEVLLLIGSQPASDWGSGWTQLISFQALILTYWVARTPLENNVKTKLEGLLGKISLPDPDKGSPRFKIVSIPEDNMPSLLDDVFSKLRVRLQQRVGQVGKISVL